MRQLDVFCLEAFELEMLIGGTEVAGSRISLVTAAPRGDIMCVDGPELLPGRSLVCVLGSRVQEYGVTRLDGLCDVVFVPFYALPKGGDTLLNDGHRITQEVLEAAAKSATTTYGIHVPLGKVSQVMTDLKRKSALQRMKNYWMKNNIYHYGVLDLHVGKNGTTASDAAGRVFALLKTILTLFVT
ncbi:uncharacterized protein LOC144119533 [Amblyomma americanum]